MLKTFGGIKNKLTAEGQASFHRALIVQKTPSDFWEFSQKNKHLFNEQTLVIFFNILTGFYEKNPQDTEILLRRKVFLIGQMIDQLLAAIPLYDCQELTQLSYALGFTKIIPEDIFNRIAEQFVSRIREATPYELSNLTRNFARADFYHEELFQTIANESIYQMIDFNPKEIANLLKSYAKMGFYHFQLMQLCAKEILFRTDVLDPTAISDIAYAFSFFNERKASLFKMLARETLKKINFFEERNIAKLTWSFAAVGWPDKFFFESIYNHILKKDIRFNVAEITQLMTVDCYLKYQFNEKQLVLFKDAESNSVFKENKTIGESEASDQIAQEVIGLAGNLKWHQNSYLEIFELDLADPEHRINIEIDGDRHHYDNHGRLFGRNALRDRILNLIGWKVLRIKMSFWNNLDVESRRIWLTNKLHPLIYSDQ